MSTIDVSGSPAVLMNRATPPVVGTRAEKTAMLLGRAAAADAMVEKALADAENIVMLMRRRIKMLIWFR